ncbi:RDD family protein [Catellatospora vulcania]|uniref:RDD family protein n=1 Tax=Catellatospora vulcania TaxID=1460450 RepID=UPI0012D42DCD|nr:RDD family protein [Catellatospora vulcania]
MSLAGWPARAAAFIVDLALLGIVLMLVRITGLADGGGGLAKAATVVVIAAHGFNRWYLGGKSGQSLGRRLLGIKLVYERGLLPIGALQAFLRDLAHVADTVVFYIGWLFPLWDAKKQTFADKITSTVVVKA